MGLHFQAYPALGNTKLCLSFFLVSLFHTPLCVLSFHGHIIGTNNGCNGRTHTVVDNWALVDVDKLRPSGSNKSVGLYMGEKRREVGRFVKYSKMYKTIIPNSIICSHYSHVPLICQSEWIFCDILISLVLHLMRSKLYLLKETLHT